MFLKEYKLGSGIHTWKGGAAYDITFIVTEGCNLRCKYCYQVNKNNNNKLTFDVAKKAIDYILDNRELFTADSVVWNFIGGEPLLEIDLIDKITDYIKVKTFKENHPWFSMYRINFSTNGILYDDKKVQKYIAKNKEKCTFGITIDGTKEKHDLQRVYEDGRGSYDNVVRNIPLWLEQFPFAGTKVTFASDDLIYLKDSIVHLWKLGIKNVPANVVFEDVWKEGDDLIFEDQLKQLADYIVDNRLWEDYDTTLFDDNLGFPLSEKSKNQNRCGAGMMLAIDGKGNFYPCLRYSSYSLENAQGYIIGNVKTGLDFDKIRPFIGLTLSIQSNNECINCEIAEGCSWCQGHCYDCSYGETNYNRVSYICKMHKARYRANEYYWARLREKENIKRSNKNNREKYLYFILSDNCIEHCNYKSLDSSNEMSEKIIKLGVEFAEKNFYKPVFLNPKAVKDPIEFNKFSYYDHIEIYDSQSNISNNNQEKFITVNSDSIDSELETDNCILNIDVSELKNLYEYTRILFEKCDRVNLNLKYDDKNFDINLYLKELNKIVELIEWYYKEKEIFKEFNKITDILFNEKMDNCNAGSKVLTLAPNGKIYACPKFYFENENEFIGDIVNGISNIKNKFFSLDKAPICKECDRYQCDRCVYLNEKFTSEYNTPSYIQCKIASIEKESSYNLYKKIKLINEKFECNEINKNFDDPVVKMLETKIIKPYALDIYNNHSNN